MQHDPMVLPAPKNASLRSSPSATNRFLAQSPLLARPVPTLTPTQTAPSTSSTGTFSTSVLTNGSLARGLSSPRTWSGRGQKWTPPPLLLLLLPLPLRLLRVLHRVLQRPLTRGLANPGLLA